MSFHALDQLFRIVLSDNRIPIVTCVSFITNFPNSLLQNFQKKSNYFKFFRHFFDGPLCSLVPQPIFPMLYLANWIMPNRLIFNLKLRCKIYVIRTHKICFKTHLFPLFSAQNTQPSKSENIQRFDPITIPYHHTAGVQKTKIHITDGTPISLYICTAVSPLDWW